VSIAVVMPAYNEEEGLLGFLTELNLHLCDWQPEFIVINDVSTDGTRDAVESIRAMGIKCKVITNEKNLGHGPSTLRALKEGLETGCDYVLAIDGDGQFLGADVAKLVETMNSGNYEVVEGVRCHRGGPLYRRVVSLATRTLVQTRARMRPTDANTPLRIYQPKTLHALLSIIPDNASTPNLLISAITRRQGIRYTEVNVESIPRRGTDIGGSTWKAKTKILPSKRFIIFCASAARQWFTTPLSKK